MQCTSAPSPKYARANWNSVVFRSAIETSRSMYSPSIWWNMNECVASTVSGR